jgi:RimJ/RimL family protein N-acetyltransferase
MKIRKANIMDMPYMIREGQEFLSWVYPDKRVDNETLIQRLRMVTTQGVCYVAEINGKQIGAIGGIITPNMWYGLEQDLTELFWWVQKEYRGSSAALRLLKQFILHGKTDPKITNVIMTKENISPISEKVYEKRGFELKESNYVMEV